MRGHGTRLTRQWCATNEITPSVRRDEASTKFKRDFWLSVRSILFVKPLEFKRDSISEFKSDSIRSAHWWRRMDAHFGNLTCKYKRLPK